MSLTKELGILNEYSIVPRKMGHYYSQVLEYGIFCLEEN